MVAVESFLSATRECGTLLPGDFVTSPGGAIASAAFTGPMTMPYMVVVDIEDPSGCVYSLPTYPIKGPAGFTLQLGTNDISTITAVNWCAQSLN